MNTLFVHSIVIAIVAVRLIDSQRQLTETCETFNFAYNTAIQYACNWSAALQCCMQHIVSLSLALKLGQGATKRSWWHRGSTRRGCLKASANLCAASQLQNVFGLAKMFATKITRWKSFQNHILLKLTGLKRAAQARGVSGVEWGEGVGSIVKLCYVAGKSVRKCGLIVVLWPRTTSILDATVWRHL